MSAITHYTFLKTIYLHYFETLKTTSGLYISFIRTFYYKHKRKVICTKHKQNKNFQLWSVVIHRAVFKSRRSSKKKKPIKLSPEYLDRLSPQSQSGSKRIHGEVMFFFSVGEAATSKWTYGEMAVFGSTVYTKFSRLNAKSCALRSLRDSTSKTLKRKC